MVLIGGTSAVVDCHADLIAQLTRIVQDGVTRGTFTAPDHGPAPSSTPPTLPRLCYARDWQQPGIDVEFEAVVDLVVRGLRA